MEDKDLQALIDNDLAPASQWHLDKRVPISLIATVLVQTFVFVWMLATMNVRVDLNTANIDRVSDTLADRYETINENSTGIAVANKALDGVQQALIRIEKKLDESKP